MGSWFPVSSLEWQEKFLDHVADYNRACTPTESAEVLRSFARTGLLRYTDMRDEPERFFAAHRLLASKILGGFGIRFTVQFNLFAGSILGLGGSDQVAMLDDLQAKGELGCFALTEVGAGVLSGFIVKTTATWDAARNGFLIDTPDISAEKNWISQGLVAEWVVVFANLVVDSKDLGPHPFVLRMRDPATGSLIPGISVVDMGKKTVANDLDNARIKFQNVYAPTTALLNRFSGMVDGKYTQHGAEPMRIEVIGQRLITGRLAIAEAAVVAVRQLFMKTRAYACEKMVNGISGPIPLCELPHLATLFKHADDQLEEIEVFTASAEARLAMHLRRGTIPDEDLVEAISVCKIRNIAVATSLEHQLEQEVGSYALMAESGFIYKDMLLCCKFAEGDTRILMQKIARDELKKASRRGLVGLVGDILMQADSSKRQHAWKLFTLARAVSAAPSPADGFAKEWEKVYALADSVCDMHLQRRPKGEEVARLLKSNPEMMVNLQQPLLVSRL